MISSMIRKLKGISSVKKLVLTRSSHEIEGIRRLIEMQKHRTLVQWALDCAPKILAIFEQTYPNDPRPRNALNAANAWAHGEILMPEAKRAALASHNAASEVSKDNPAACAAARAMGHVVGTIHVETHALGLVFYGITAIIRKNPAVDEKSLIEEELKWFFDRLLYWERHIDEINQKWVAFLLRDDLLNKEHLLRMKQEKKTL